MSIIFRESIPEWFNNELKDIYIKKLIKKNKKIDITFDEFNNLTNNQKKIIFPYILENEYIDEINFTFLPDVNGHKDKYLLNYDEMKYFQKEIEDKFDKLENLKNIKVKIDPYNLIRFSSMKNINKIDKVIEIPQQNMYNLEYVKDHKKIERLGVYILPKNASPGFKNFRMQIRYLSKNFNLYLFIDNNEDEMDDIDKEILKKLENVYYVGSMDDKSLSELIYEKKLTILISIYGFYKRKIMILTKPAAIMVSFQEPPVIYPKTCYDYNLIDKNLYNVLKKFNIDEDKFNFITLKKNFILPIPLYSSFNKISEPQFDETSIKIGIIMYPPKINYEVIDLINSIIKINKNIIVTIYGYMQEEWIKMIFPSDQIRHDKYDNSNPVKLLENILFLDPMFINSHSTALEIIKIKRPIIGYVNKDKYLGNFTQSLMKSLNMEKYFLADNLNDYIKLVKLYVYSKELYLKMYSKFIKKLNESSILEEKYYINDFIDNLNSFYKNYKK